MKIGIVGHGSIGSRHAANLRSLGHQVLVFDPVGERDVKFERNIYDSDVEAVVIATPSNCHEGPMRACIERGKHMLVEKPISTSIGALPELLRVAGDKKLVVMMGNNLRFHPCVRQAREWIDNGEIGPPIWAHFTCGQRSIKRTYTDVGVILNTGAHEVDMARWLLGPARVVSANARVCDSMAGIEDIADFMLEHDNGCRSTFHLDFVTPNEIREAWIVGADERIGIELRNRNISLGARAIGKPDGYDEDYLAEIKAFILCIECGDYGPAATGVDGLATLETLLYVRKKAGLK